MKKLKLKTSKAAIKGSLRDHTRVDDRPYYGKLETGKAMVEKVQLTSLLDDFSLMLKHLRKAGYDIEQPSGKRQLSGEPFEEIVPEFLRKDRPETKSIKQKRVRL